MAIADQIMSGVRAARVGGGQIVDSDEASRLIIQLRTQVPSLRTPNGQTQLRATLEKLAKTKLLSPTELAVLRSACDGDPARLSPQPTVHTQAAPSEGHNELYATRFAGGPAPDEGYHSIRSHLMTLVHEGQEKHDQNAVHAARDLVEALDTRFNKAAVMEKSVDVEKWLSGQQNALPTLEQIRARAFGRV